MPLADLEVVILWMRMKMDARCERSPSRRKMFIVLERAATTVRQLLELADVWSRQKRGELTAPYELVDWYANGRACCFARSRPPESRVL